MFLWKIYTVLVSIVLSMNNVEKAVNKVSFKNWYRKPSTVQVLIKKRYPAPINNRTVCFYRFDKNYNYANYCIVISTHNSSLSLSLSLQWSLLGTWALISERQGSERQLWWSTLFSVLAHSEMMTSFGLMRHWVLRLWWISTGKISFLTKK